MKAGRHRVAIPSKQEKVIEEWIITNILTKALQKGNIASVSEDHLMYIKQSRMTRLYLPPVLHMHISPSSHRVRSKSSRPAVVEFRET
jgi:hypothetical protein